jgi:hypothetical protein
MPARKAQRLNLKTVYAVTVVTLAVLAVLVWIALTPLVQ